MNQRRCHKNSGFQVSFKNSEALTMLATFPHGNSWLALSNGSPWVLSLICRSRSCWFPARILALQLCCRPTWLPTVSPFVHLSGSLWLWKWWGWVPGNLRPPLQWWKVQCTDAWAPLPIWWDDQGVILHQFREFAMGLISSHPPWQLAW